MSQGFARFTLALFAAVVFFGSSGCSSGGGGSPGWLPGKTGWGPENGTLTYADFGTKFGVGGRPVIEFEQLAANRLAVHVATVKPDPSNKPADYRAYIKPAVNSGDPNSDKQALRLRAFVQLYYPFLNITDGQSYVVGDRPAAQTDHIVAGSESTIFLLQVDHAGSDVPEMWIHRLYVLKIDPGQSVYCWAQEGMNQAVTQKKQDVPLNNYAEVTLKDGRWQITKVEPIPASGKLRDFVNDMVAMAGQMGLPVP